jgi:YD repeat-containing protein
VTRYDLDFDGRVRVLRDAGGAEVARWEHAGPGDPVRIAHRDAGARDYLRDAAGRLAEMTDADGTVLRYGLDVLGRVVSVDSIVAGDGGADVVTRLRTMTYDADPDPGHPSAGRFLSGRIAVIDEGGNTFRWSYDRAGRPVREAQEVAGVAAAVQREYDVQGRLTSLTYPDQARVDYDLDPTGAVVRVARFADDLEYGPDGLLRRYVADNGMTVEMPRSRRPGGCRRSAQPPRRRTAARPEYGYDATGSIASLLDVAPADTESESFGYDGLHRLTTATVRAGGPAGAVIRSHAFTYDAAGNLQHFGDVHPVDLAYGDAGRPGRVTTVTGGGAPPRQLTYGARGEVSSTGTLTGMTYDVFTRLVSGDCPGAGQGRIRCRSGSPTTEGRVLKEVQSARDGAHRYLSPGLWEASDSVIRAARVPRHPASRQRDDAGRRRSGPADARLRPPRHRSREHRRHVRGGRVAALQPVRVRARGRAAARPLPRARARCRARAAPARGAVPRPRPGPVPGPRLVHPRAPRQGGQAPAGLRRLRLRAEQSAVVQGPLRPLVRHRRPDRVRRWLRDRLRQRPHLRARQRARLGQLADRPRDRPHHRRGGMARMERRRPARRRDGEA